MKTLILLAGVMLLALTATAPPAHAQNPNCDPWASPWLQCPAPCWPNCGTPVVGSAMVQVWDLGFEDLYDQYNDLCVVAGGFEDVSAEDNSGYALACMVQID
jgi:hypothetical protein